MAHPSPSSPRIGEVRDDPAARPVLLMPRRIPGGVLATLDALPIEALPRLDHEGPAAGLRRAMRAALAERLPRPRWLANWLLDDVLDQAALMAELTGGAALRVALEVVQGGDGEADRPLASARARTRLITAYRGAGVDWLPPRVAAGSVLGPGAAWDGSAVAPLRRLPRGDVAVLRGDGAGVAHRAARSGSGTAWLLTIDEADRPVRGASPLAERRAAAAG